jgi:hypothetical protein
MHRQGNKTTYRWHLLVLFCMIVGLAPTRALSPDPFTRAKQSRSAAVSHPAFGSGSPSER